MAETTKNVSVDWAPIQPEGEKPVPRGGHTAVAADSSLVVFGGHSYGGNSKFSYYNDTHLFDADTCTWHNVKCSGELPPARYGHSVALVGSRMFIFGGKGENGALFRDVHFLDLVTWAWVPVSSTTAGPSPRMNQASVLVGRKIVVHGGWDGAKRCLSDLWVFDTDSFTWMCPKTAGLPPSPRYGHDLQLLDDGRILLFGGTTVKEGEIPLYHSDLRQLDTESMVWSKPRVEADLYPSARYSHSLTHMGSQLVLFGGWGLGGLQSSEENKRTGAESFFAYDIQSSSWWRPTMPAKAMEHKFGHTATRLGDSMFVFGGWSGKQASNTLMQLILCPV